MKPLLVKIGMFPQQRSTQLQQKPDNIINSIKKCKEMKCTIRVGSELEVPGYSCHDHFNQYDTIIHFWQVIRDIIKSGVTEDIVCDLGSPVIHHGNIYNCRVILYNNKVIGIRAKTILADGDNYYQTRWFGFWKDQKQVDQYKLPKIIQEVTGQTTVPIGVFLIDFNDACIGYEICQQAWISNNPMIEATMDGVQIVFNPSASNVQCGKLSRKIQMIKQLTQKHGGAYLYTNIRGCTGDRIYFDGGCIFAQDGVVKGLSNLISMEDVEITPVVVNVTKIRTFRLSNKSFLKSGNSVHKIVRVKIDINVCKSNQKYQLRMQQSKFITKLVEQYQFPHARYEPSLYLWDFLRKSRSGGFFLPLSGDLQSSAVAMIVYNMCCLVYNEIKQQNNQKVLQDLRNIIGIKHFDPKSPEEICNKIFYTCYMRKQFSFSQNKKIADEIAKQINSHHRCIDFHDILQSLQKYSVDKLGKKFRPLQKDSKISDPVLRNMESRTKLLLSYMLAETELESIQRDSPLIVLGCANLDQQLIGCLSRYDSSAADINPIGSFSRFRLKQFMQWNNTIHQFGFLNDIINSTSMEQLIPTLQKNNGQNAENIGLTYQQVEKFAVLRRKQKLGPVSIFQAICISQQKGLKPRQIAQKVKIFFRLYGKNRQKMSVNTPCFHYYAQNCDDTRLDVRPMFYQTNWDYHFNIIDEKVLQLQKQQSQKQLNTEDLYSLVLKIKGISKKSSKINSVQ